MATHAECAYWIPAGDDTPVLAALGYGRCCFARSLPVRPSWLGDTALVPGASEIECAAFVPRAEDP